MVTSITGESEGLVESDLPEFQLLSKTGLEQFKCPDLVCCPDQAQLGALLPINPVQSQLVLEGAANSE